MADQYDALAAQLGIPPAMVPQWRARAGAPPAAPALQPGDPGFSIAQPPAGPPAAPAAPPPGPRPGDPGFSVAQFGGPAPGPIAAPTGQPAPRAPMAAPRPPPKPMSLADQIAASNASIDQTIAQRAETKGLPMITLPAATAEKLVAASKASDKNASGANDAAKNKKNLEGATFFDPSSGKTVPGASLVQVSPGGRTPASWTTQTQEGIHLDPETKEAATKAEESQLDAAAWGRNAGVAEANRELAYLQTHEQAQAQRQQLAEQRAEQQRKAYESQLAKLENLTQQVREDKIDDRAFFNNGANSFFAVLGVLLGGIGQGMVRRGGGNTENQGMVALNNAIAQNIEAQKANAQLHRGQLEDQRSLLGQMAKTFGDERTAEDAAWIAYLEKAKTKLAQAAAESKSDFVQARYRAAIADVDGQIAGRREKWNQMEQDRIMRVQHDVNAPPQFVGKGAGVATDKHTDEQVKNMSEAYEKAGIPQALSQLRDADRAIDTLGKGDIEGVGMGADIAFGIPAVGQKVGKAIYGDRAVAARQAVATIKNGIRKSIAGASLTENEKKELDKQLEGSNDADSLRRVVQSFRQTLSIRAKNIAAMSNDKGRAEYTRRYEAIDHENGPFSVPLDKGASPYVRPPE